MDVVFGCNGRMRKENERKMKGKRKCFPHLCLETGREGGKEKEK
jgi:hypothetical protein